MRGQQRQLQKPRGGCMVGAALACRALFKKVVAHMALWALTGYCFPRVAKPAMDHTATGCPNVRLRKVALADLLPSQRGQPAQGQPGPGAQQPDHHPGKLGQLGPFNNGTSNAAWEPAQISLTLSRVFTPPAKKLDVTVLKEADANSLLGSYLFRKIAGALSKLSAYM